MLGVEALAVAALLLGYASSCESHLVTSSLPSFALVEPRAAFVHFVSKEQMNVLMRCNGEWDFDSILTPATDRTIVNQAIEKGFVEACAEGDGLASEQQYKRFPNRFMQRIRWSITGKCNYRCRHCYMSAPDAHFGELSHDAIMDIAQQIGACGIPQVSLTGGEPLIRPDFLDIVTALTKQGVAINQLYTNGALLSENILDGLAVEGQCKVCQVRNHELHSLWFGSWLCYLVRITTTGRENLHRALP